MAGPYNTRPNDVISRQGFSIWDWLGSLANPVANEVDDYNAWNNSNAPAASKYQWGVPDPDVSGYYDWKKTNTPAAMKPENAGWANFDSDTQDYYNYAQNNEPAIAKYMTPAKTPSLREAETASMANAPAAPKTKQPSLREAERASMAPQDPYQAATRALQRSDMNTTIPVEYLLALADASGGRSANNPFNIQALQGQAGFGGNRIYGDLEAAYGDMVKNLGYGTYGQQNALQATSYDDFISRLANAGWWGSNGAPQVVRNAYSSLYG